MAAKTPEPKIIRPDDIDPHHRWDRPLQAPGHTQVDFEERVDFRRLHDYRLARTRAALAQLGPGRAAVLRPAQHPLHHQHGDRRVGARQAHALLAAHRQRRPLRLGLRLGRAPPPALRAVAATRTTAAPGMLGMRGAVGADVGLFRDAAKEIKAHPRRRRAWRDMPLGIDVVEPPMLFALQKLGIEVRDGQQVMLRGARGQEHRRADAAQHGRGDGATASTRTSSRRSSPACARTRSSRSPPSGSTRWARTASRRSTRSPASAAARIRTTSPTA